MSNSKNGEFISKSVETRTYFKYNIRLEQRTHQNPQWPPIYDKVGFQFSEKAKSEIRKMRKARGITGDFDVEFCVLGATGVHFIMYSNVHIENGGVNG